MSIEVSIQQKAALERLLRNAQGETGQSRKVANFLLAWWNAEECGGFDFTNLWRVDEATAADMVTVFEMLASRRAFPDELGYDKQFNNLLTLWRSYSIAR